MALAPNNVRTLNGHYLNDKGNQWAILLWDEVEPGDCQYVIETQVNGSWYFLTQVQKGIGFAHIGAFDVYLNPIRVTCVGTGSPGAFVRTFYSYVRRQTSAYNLATSHTDDNSDPGNPKALFDLDWQDDTSFLTRIGVQLRRVGGSGAPFWQTQATPGISPYTRLPAYLFTEGSSYPFAADSRPGYNLRNLPALLYTGTPAADKIRDGDTIEVRIETLNESSAAVPFVTNLYFTYSGAIVFGRFDQTAHVGTAFSYNFTTGLAGSVSSWSSANLPPGLSFNTTTAVLSGTPTKAGTFTFQIFATNAQGNVTTGNFTLVVTPIVPPVITGPATADLHTVHAASVQLVATGEGPKTYARVSGTLPPGLTLNTTTGLISGTPTTPCTRNVTFKARNAGGASAPFTVAFTVTTLPVPVITGPASVTVAQRSSVNVAIVATKEPTSYAIEAGTLPAGLSLNTSNGHITGTPTDPDSTTVTFTATNENGTSDEFDIDFTVTALPVPVITGPSSVSVVQHSAVNVAIVATQEPTSYAIESGTLPTGLSLNTDTGRITGTPTSAGGPTNVTFSATNDNGTSADFVIAFTVTALPVPVITGPATVTAVQHSTVDIRIVATQQPTSYSVFSGTLPTGLSLNTSTGHITGTPTSAGGPTNVTFKATNANGTSTGFVIAFTITSLPPPVITGPTRAVLDQLDPADVAIVATRSPTSYSVFSGTLPDGLSLNTSTGHITGTPTTPGGPTNVTFKATNPNGTSAGFVIKFTIVAIDVPEITGPAEVSLQAYDVASVEIQASGNPDSFAIVDGTLPAGLSLNTSTGVISGTPTTGGTADVTFTATNAGGDSDEFTIEFTIIPLDPPAITSAASASVVIGNFFHYEITSAPEADSYAATGLAPGLTRIGNVISGIITSDAGASYDITINGTNDAGEGPDFHLILSVQVLAPVLVNAASGGRVGIPFSYSINADNGPTVYGATNLPEEFTVDEETGEISGTPAAAGTLSIGISATNSAGTATATLTLTILPAAVVLPPVVIPITSTGDLIMSRTGRTDGGLDRLLRTIKVDALPEAIDPPSLYQALSGKPSMFLMDFQPRCAGGSATEIDLVFHGSLDGTLPPPKSENGFSLQTASTTDGEQQLEVLYRSPQTVWTWIGRSDTEITYSGLRNPRPIQIVRRTIDGHVPLVYRLDDLRLLPEYITGDDETRAKIDAYIDSLEPIVQAYKDRIAAYFNQVFAEQEEIIDFSAPVLVPGQFWRCQATSAKTLIAR